MTTYAWTPTIIKIHTRNPLNPGSDIDRQSKNNEFRYITRLHVTVELEWMRINIDWLTSETHTIFILIHSIMNMNMNGLMMNEIWCLILNSIVYCFGFDFHLESGILMEYHLMQKKFHNKKFFEQRFVTDVKYTFSIWVISLPLKISKIFSQYFFFSSADIDRIIINEKKRSQSEHWDASLFFSITNNFHHSHVFRLNHIV